jgi:hypothetical protein
MGTKLRMLISKLDWVFEKVCLPIVRDLFLPKSVAEYTIRNNGPDFLSTDLFEPTNPVLQVEQHARGQFATILLILLTTVWLQGKALWTRTGEQSDTQPQTQLLSNCRFDQAIEHCARPSQ